MFLPGRSRKANRWVAIFSFPQLFLVLFLKKDNLIDSTEIGRGADSASAIGSTTTVANTLSTAEIGCCRHHRSGRATTGWLLCSQGQRNANTRMRLDSIWVHLPKCEPLHEEWLGCSSDPVTYYADHLPTASKGYSWTMGHSMLVDVDLTKEAKNLNVKQTTNEIK